MAINVGLDAGISSAETPGASFPITQVLESCDAATVNYTEQLDEFDATPLNTSGFTSSTYVPGIKQLTGTITARYLQGANAIGDTASLTHSGVLSIGAGTEDIRVTSATLTINYVPQDVTALQLGASSASQRWREFVCGKYDATLSFSGFATTDLGGLGADSNAVLGSEVSTAFKLQEQTADLILSGSAMIVSFSPTFSPGIATSVSGSMRYTGDITVSNATETEILPTGTLAIPAAETLTITQSSGNTISGEALASSIGITLNPTGLIEVSAGFNSTGAWS